jgi:hypothetical protein
MLALSPNHSQMQFAKTAPTVIKLEDIQGGVDNFQLKAIPKSRKMASRII